MKIILKYKKGMPINLDNVDLAIPVIEEHIKFLYAIWINDKPYNPKEGLEQLKQIKDESKV